jgi:glutaminyl-peptide cyclotransferase
MIVSDIEPTPYNIKIIKTYAHNPAFYTQGLEFDNGILYEGTGQWKQSGLYKYVPEKGEILQSINLPDEMFGEGITILNDKIYQLTWRNNTGFVYDKTTFKRLSEFHYATEGWGLTNNGNELIMSDGSETLYFMDADQFQELRRIYVYSPKGPVTNLNELEYINGLVYANVYTTNTIVAIDPNTGKVVKHIDLSVLLNQLNGHKQIDVLNGIAYDKTRNRLLVTGKWWPLLFEIELKRN